VEIILPEVLLTVPCWEEALGVDTCQKSGDALQLVGNSRNVTVLIELLLVERRLGVIPPCMESVFFYEHAIPSCMQSMEWPRKSGMRLHGA
jgi:hypothetical protein